MTELRSTDQNAKMWALLNEIAQQKQYYGQWLSAEDWKALFCQMVGHEQRFMTSFDGRTIVATSYTTRHLSRREMATLIETMLAWGNDNDVQFRSER